MTQVLVEAELDYLESVDHECERPLAVYEQAIADFLVDCVHWLDVRLLWCEGDTTFFRINYWSVGERVGDARITRSKFLAVDELLDGLSVRDLTSMP